MRRVHRSRNCSSPTAARSPSASSARPRAGHPHRRHLLARRPLRPAPLQGRRGLSRRQARRADPRLPRHRRHRRPGQASIGVDAIHPGYGFLSENADVRPGLSATPGSPSSARARSLEQLGDKVAARAHRQAGRVPDPLRQRRRRCIDRARRKKLAESSAIPVIVKASMGGGGRGMRVVRRADKLDEALEQAQREAGSRVRRPRRVPRKVRPAGPAHRGAAPRRPARQPRPPLRARLLGPAAAPEGRRARPGPEPRLPASASGSSTPPSPSAGRSGSTTPAPSSSSSTSTRQVLLHRGQPAHPGRAHRHRGRSPASTSFESQILVAPGHAADRPRNRPGANRRSRTHGFAIQCRVTTEDPANKFRARLRPAQRTTARPAAWASASTPARRSPARSSRRSTIRCW